jgi:hypothetical protein
MKLMPTLDDVDNHVDDDAENDAENDADNNVVVDS